MQLPSSLLSLLAAILASAPLVSSESTPSPAPKPCTIRSPSSGSFFDLRPLQVKLLPSSASSAASPADPSNPDTEKPKPESWHSRGHDYPANFTLNLCGAVVEDISDVDGIPKARWQNVSAYYKTAKGNIFSIGQQNSEPLFRGRKLILNYTNGSPCPDLDSDGQPLDTSSFLFPRQFDQYDTDPFAGPHDISSSEIIPSKPTSSNRKKNTLMTFTCDTSPSLTTHPSISFLGTPDHCTYIFEVRSRYACAGATGPAPDSSSLSPTGVFLVILGIAFLVYLIGGCVYQRSVLHQRGWRQLPNYSVWAGCLGFIGVSVARVLLLVISCGRMGGRRTRERYGHLSAPSSRDPSTSRNGNARSWSRSKILGDEERF